METSTKFITIGDVDSEDAQVKFKAIVIGAGISGLSAAKWLQDWGIDSVLVLEARDRVGGRTLTKRDSRVKYVDLGGSYVGPTQNHLFRLSKELGIETYKVNEEEKLIYYSENYGRILHGRDDLPAFWSPLKNMDLNHFFRIVDEFGKEIPSDCPWKAPHAEEWDKMSVREFGEKCLYSKTTLEILEALCSAFVASEAYESSFLWFLWYIKISYGTKRIFSSTNGGQERKFIGGSQQISERLAAILGHKVVLNKPVVEIDQRGSSVLVSTLDGNEYEADYVILAIPPALQMKIHFQPSLPTLRNQMIQRVPMGSVIKIMIYYKKNFWREKGMCGTSFVMGSDEHPVVYTFDDTKPDGSVPALVGFIAGDKARRLSKLTPEERKIMIAKSLSKVFGCPEALEPIHYEEHNWMAEQYSGGCYTAMFPPGCFTMYGQVLREPIGKLYFAGTETSIIWSGYMEGAVAAGERAAREILCVMGKISKSQIWREEPVSKEFPPLPFPVSFYERHMPSACGFLKMVSWSTLLLAIGASAFIYNKHARLFR